MARRRGSEKGPTPAEKDNRHGNAAGSGLRGSDHDRVTLLQIREECGWHAINCLLAVKRPAASGSSRVSATASTRAVRRLFPWRSWLRRTESSARASRRRPIGGNTVEAPGNPPGHQRRGVSPLGFPSELSGLALFFGGIPNAEASGEGSTPRECYAAIF